MIFLCVRGSRAVINIPETNSIIYSGISNKLLKVGEDGGDGGDDGDRGRGRVRGNIRTHLFHIIREGNQVQHIFLLLLPEYVFITSDSGFFSWDFLKQGR